MVRPVSPLILESRLLIVPLDSRLFSRGLF
jgi:hypothetical protein